MVSSLGLSPTSAAWISHLRKRRSSSAILVRDQGRSERPKIEFLMQVIKRTSVLEEVNGSDILMQPRYYPVSRLWLSWVRMARSVPAEGAAGGGREGSEHY
ncbi:hypothetical protein VPH35_093737 [Triticum aestivum]